MSNFHAKDAITGRNFPTKKSLREAIANPQQRPYVLFTDTSAFNNRGTVGVDGLSASDVIVGPDPYTARNWYANVKNGKVI